MSPQATDTRGAGADLSARWSVADDVRPNVCDTGKGWSLVLNGYGIAAGGLASSTSVVVPVSAQHIIGPGDPAARYVQAALPLVSGLGLCAPRSTTRPTRILLWNVVQAEYFDDPMAGQRVVARVVLRPGQPGVMVERAIPVPCDGPSTGSTTQCTPLSGWPDGRYVFQLQDGSTSVPDTWLAIELESPPPDVRCCHRLDSRRDR